MIPDGTPGIMSPENIKSFYVYIGTFEKTKFTKPPRGNRCVPLGFKGYTEDIRPKTKGEVGQCRGRG